MNVAKFALVFTLVCPYVWFDGILLLGLVPGSWWGWNGTYFPRILFWPVTWSVPAACAYALLGGGSAKSLSWLRLALVVVIVVVTHAALCALTEPVWQESIEYQLKKRFDMFNTTLRACLVFSPLIVWSAHFADRRAARLTVGMKEQEDS